MNGVCCSYFRCDATANLWGWSYSLVDRGFRQEGIIHNRVKLLYVRYLWRPKHRSLTPSGVIYPFPRLRASSYVNLISVKEVEYSPLVGLVGPIAIRDGGQSTFGALPPYVLTTPSFLLIHALPFSDPAPGSVFTLLDVDGKGEEYERFSEVQNRFLHRRPLLSAVIQGNGA